MRPLFNKIFGIVLGSLFAVIAFMAIHSGRVGIGKRYHRSYVHVAQEPRLFWFIVGSYALISIVFLWFAFKGGKK
ncbi:MAG TPA: hypothetical protein VNN22_11425 [Verrucomicrobiae bacterium]|nr:hypothetical protein [Verrucomicrobiae bacterium]